MKEIHECPESLIEVSPMYDNLIDTNGNGIAGFTIHYSITNFENIISSYNEANHRKIVSDLEAKRLSYISSMNQKPVTKS